MRIFVEDSDLNIRREREFVLSVKLSWTVLWRIILWTVLTGLKGSWEIRIFSFYLWSILTKVLTWVPVIFRITTLKFWFCGNRIFHWLLHFFPSFENQFWLFVIVKNKLASAFYAQNYAGVMWTTLLVDLQQTLTMLWRNSSSIRGQTPKNWRQFVNYLVAEDDLNFFLLCFLNAILFKRGTNSRRVSEFCVCCFIENQTNTSYQMNPSEPEANTSNRCQARENACVKDKIGYDFPSDWLRKWREIF